MLKRPMAVEFVAWLLAIFSVYMMVRALWAYDPPDPMSPVELVRNPDNTPAIVNGTFAILFFTSGVNIAKGRNWSRWLYVITCLVLTGVQVYFVREHLYDTKWYLVVLNNILRYCLLLLLFLPSSNDYFATPDRMRW